MDLLQGSVASVMTSVPTLHPLKGAQNGYPAKYLKFHISEKQMAELQQVTISKYAKLLITLFHKTLRRRPSLLSRFVMVSVKTSFTAYIIVYEIANYSPAKIFFRKTFVLSRILAKAQKL